MSLIKPKPTYSRDPDAFPIFQLFILAIVRLAEPIALTSIFPYAWALIKHFQIGQESDASFYAGVLISAFSLAEAMMGMYWGGLSDRIGRKPVLLVGCVGTMFSMIAVGLAPNIWVALAGRAAGGFLNGNIGVIQTMVGELVTKPEHEPRAYAIMPFVWSIGTIIGPAIGGTFSDPRASFPGVFSEGCLFDRFPFLLPNLVCALLLFISIVLGYFLLQETHPDLQHKADCAPADSILSPVLQQNQHDFYKSFETPLLETSDALKRPAVDVRTNMYGTFQRGRGSQWEAEGSSSAESSTVCSSRSSSSTSLNKYFAEKKRRSVQACPPVSIFSRRIMAVVLALAIFTYHSMAYDSTLPVFFEDDRVLPFPGSGGSGGDNSTQLPSFPAMLFYSPGGLGLSLRSVGMIMAVDGAIALFVQAVVFPLAAAWMGVYQLFIVATVLHPLAYMLLPCLLYVPACLLYPAIYACMAVRTVFAIIIYPLLLILIKEATPSASILGKVNGMAASAGAACRMIAPPIAGYLYTVGSRMNCTALVWYSGVVVALIGAAQCFSVARPRDRLQTEPQADPEAELSIESAEVDEDFYSMRSEDDL